MNVKIAQTDEEIEACFPVMTELRPHLQQEEFLNTIRSMERSGYRLVYLSVAGKPVAVAGYRVQRMLCCEPFLYVDDLVTAEVERSQGYGASLLEWLMNRAGEEGCGQLHLDSGIQRKDAHRFYERQGMEVSGLHFRINVRRGAEE